MLGGQAEFGVDWLPSLFSNREQGNDLVNIAQVYARSGTTEVTFKSSGINSMAKMKGKKYGVWIFGNEFEQEAALVKAGLDPKKDVTLVKQNFDMVAFLKGEIDAASAMTYNELAQVLETKNPKTGKLYQLSDLNVFKMSALGTGMLQDGIFTKGDWIADPANQATAVKFLQATFKGWVYCRDHANGVHQHRRQAGHGAAARPPGLADERGQRADLAEPARDRDHGSGAVEADELDRDEVQGDQEAGHDGLVPHRPREEGGRSAQGAGRGRHRQGLQEVGRSSSRKAASRPTGRGPGSRSAIRGRSPPERSRRCPC